jgi:excisionase family DNA binding protein
MTILSNGNSLPRLYTPDEVAEYLHLSLSKVYQEIRVGAIPSILLGRCVRVKEADLAEYLRRYTRNEFED